jgi:hypothetical protein
MDETLKKLFERFQDNMKSEFDKINEKFDKKFEEQNLKFDKINEKFDKKFEEQNLKIEQLNLQVQMTKTQQSGPNTFFEALSPAAVIGAPKKFVNPAYQE